jgi:hypothetical protein
MNDELFSMTDALDHEILMHRDAHFAGDFTVMLDYYRKEGRGVYPEFDIPRIERLAALELQLNQNLAPLILSGNEAEKIAATRKAYKSLRDIYEMKNKIKKGPQLIADLILTEDEEAEAEIAAIVKEGQTIVPELIELLRNEDFHDPLFPGYGQAPNMAVKCLGLIGDKRAIISLFEAIGEGDFFSDEMVFRALKKIGAPAKDFLLRVLCGRPLTEDNERAAIALIEFKEDPMIAETCFTLLKDPSIFKDPCLPTYLVLACAHLKDPLHQAEFIAWSKESSLSRQLREDMKSVIAGWQEI